MIHAAQLAYCWWGRCDTRSSVGVLLQLLATAVGVLLVVGMRMIHEAQVAYYW